jgi:hypothetical protein
MSAGQARTCFELFSLEIAFWRNGDAAKDLLVKVSQQLPILSDKIGVNIFRGNSH